MDNINFDNLVPKEKSFMKVRENGILLSDEDINILEEFEIDYRKFNNLQELLFEITKCLNVCGDEAYQLEELSIKLGEYNYYNYTNK